METTNYAITPIQCAVHRISQSAIYGEGVINIRLQDDGGGAFFEISSNDAGEQKIKCDPIELKLLAEAAEMLLAGVGKFNA